MPTRSLPRLAAAACALATALVLTGLVLATGGAVPPASAAAAATAAPVRVMALGDSITGNPGCWRALLHRDLTAAGHAVDMVGSLPAQGCGIAHDGDNEGHGGALVTDVAASGRAAAWFAAARPQVVLLHFATNDVWSARTPAQVLDAWTTLLRQARAVDPRVVLVVAQIVPVAPPTCAECPERTRALNAQVPAWAAAHSTAASPVLVVDQWTGWDAARDTGDGVHPNDAGVARMAAAWYPAVVQALRLVPGQVTTPVPTTPAPTTPAPTTSAPTPTPSATAPSPADEGCRATTTVQSTWPGGWVATVRVTAGDAPIRGWRVQLVGGLVPSVAHVWNATFDGGSFTNAPWNGALAAGAATELGYQGRDALRTPRLRCVATTG
ncbi:GDSL-type esterase/lipase family protein [Cellulomonas sp.]|uniref:GDSL-type esterase/lipase family protein n=1 Tax=Cellulomonas sp. TaxID=40001 RepID=UPI002811AA0B|nr:GDSL-type esterase/lipase family protein [Cellulomonas sp.]